MASRVKHFMNAEGRVQKTMEQKKKKKWGNKVC